MEQFEKEFDSLWYTSHGKAVIEELIRWCDDEVPDFDACPYKNAYNSGKRSIGTRIKQMVDNVTNHGKL